MNKIKQNQNKISPQNFQYQAKKKKIKKNQYIKLLSRTKKKITLT